MAQREYPPVVDPWASLDCSVADAVRDDPADLDPTDA
jgi:hypothetical protein